VPAPFETDGQLEYAPLAHPEVPLQTGKLLVTVSRNTTDFQRLLQEPEVGVPRFVEIDLP
jgi:hypothetical protein